MNKKWLKLMAVIGAFLLFSVLLVLVQKLIVPEEWLKNYSLNCVMIILQEVVIISLFVLLAAKVFKIKINLGRKNVVKGIFWYGLVLCIAVVVNFVTSYIAPEKSIPAALPLVLLTLVAYMLVGVQEEVSFRGILFGVCREYFGESKKGIYLSVLISALTFGCMHLSNLLVYPSLVVATITQVIYAAEVGIIFAVTYYRSGNLLPCIILHGLIDFAASFWLCFADNVNDALNVQNTTDIDIASALGSIAICLPFVVSGLWQLRTVFKNREADRVTKEASD